MPNAPSPEVRSLIRDLDAAVEVADPRKVCEAVKKALVAAIGPDKSFLDERFVQPASDKYARRLLHRDPRGRYSVVVMVWGAGQGTPLHDHAGKWCVEGVYHGRIEVKSYDLENGGGKSGLYRFRLAGEVVAGRSEAGHLIPPFEYHTIRNADAAPSVTIHVYSEEMKTFHVFLPKGEGFRRERRQTYYTD